MATAVLNGTMALSNSTAGYYNATEMSFAEGLNASDSRLLGTRVGTVSAGGSISTSVPSHGIAMWRLRAMDNSQRKDEL